MKKILVTGGAGFIGSAFVRYLLRTHDDVQVVNYDKLTYCGNLENLRDVEKDPRYSFVKGDIGNLDEALAALGQDTDAVVNFAAESHNDRGVLDPGIFLRTNVVGTQAMLEACRRAGVGRFHHISTCEVFGDLALDEERAFSENDAFRPRTPYNASKASTDHVVMAYHHTFGLPVTISHCCNNYGPYQFPEKLIPLFSTNAMEDKSLPLFKSSQNRREWIHCDDHSAAVDLILEKGRVGEAYNIGTGIEKSVEEITDVILDTLGKPATLKSYVPDRQGHDRRYLLSTEKIRAELSWAPKIGFDEGIKQTVEWYRDNPDWWQRVKSGAYQDYYHQYYFETLKDETAKVAV
ncbi:dTDP-glucose 4,6-dehydratase [Candidatus Uhrbacteria bacterium RIFOXYC2_FULL_47_19]|uniref:dTDP-glucose 4,6-dehydratase n=1 Tax=Candidatus Uhrbacteria bacterium RIFOXYC2_FULL_47_19 TaxID=1802424 RepID=A0A1F7WCE5_9BACT|nr:MAG: dTDP-glucose 4,6-dehydratase [Candidatus Uhrbacteria bacterium RIFOXYC2_FULL_47_19]HCC22512.1 dTDP-glucose 4,6-dehydratase [Candidatus Uhrbacteria bacterium]